MLPAMNNRIYHAPATADPSNHNTFPKRLPSWLAHQSDTALIYSTENHTGLWSAYMRSPSQARRLRATAPAFAPGDPKPETVYENDETETNTSDSEAETDISSVVSTSDISSKHFSLPQTSRSRVLHRQRFALPLETAQSHTNYACGDDGGVYAPGAPRISFPPSPCVERDTILTSRVRLDLQLDYPPSMKPSLLNPGLTVHFDPFGEDEDEEEEAHYHLPKDLFSTEPEMSSAGFAAMVRGWTQRRLEANMRTEVLVGRMDSNEARRLVR
jgi:hypothetical protein